MMYKPPATKDFTSNNTNMEIDPNIVSRVREGGELKQAKETSKLFTEVHLHQEGYVSVEVPTKGGLSRRATCLTQFTTKGGLSRRTTCLTQFTTKVNCCSLRNSTKEG
jgi:non-canonical (house-cleaning) NTP pyrophosphatase